MSRFLSLTGVLLVAALAVADAQDSPASKDKKAEVKSKAQPPAPIFSPHGMPVRTEVGGDPTKRQPGRVEYSYPLKGEEERRKSVKGLQQLTVDLLALHNMYNEA